MATLTSLWPDELDARLAEQPSTAYLTASAAWATLQPSPLAGKLDRAIVCSRPRAWLAICLQTSHANTAQVLKFLNSGGAIRECLPIVRAALELVTDGQLVPPPTRLGCLKLLLRYCVDHAATTGDTAAVSMVRCIVCALSRRLSLDSPRSEPVIKLLRDGLGGSNKRVGLVLLEPLRRLCLLAAARELQNPSPPAAFVADSNPLVAYAELVASVDTSAPTFRFLPATMLSELLPFADAAGTPSGTAPGGAAVHPCATLVHALRTRLAPLLSPAAAGAAAGGGDPSAAAYYQWADTLRDGDGFLASGAVHAALERALRPGAMPRADAGAVAAARRDVLRAAAGDAGELLCACVELMQSALPPAPLASRPEAAPGTMRPDEDEEDSEALDARVAAAATLLGALLGTVPPSARGGGQAGVQAGVHGAPAASLPTAAWLVALDESVRMAMAAEDAPSTPPGDAAACVRAGRAMRVPLPSAAAEAAALAHWWPAVMLELRERKSHSQVLEAILRRAGRIGGSSSAALSSDAATYDDVANREGFADAGGPAPAKRARIVGRLRAPPPPPGLSASDARNLIAVSPLYVPVALPLLRGGGDGDSTVTALTLVHELALSSAPEALARLNQRAAAAASGAATSSSEGTAAGGKHDGAPAAAASKEPVGLAAALMRACHDNATPLAARCGLALLPLWYDLPTPRTEDPFGASATADALDASAADLALAAHSAALLRALYLPPPASATAGGGERAARRHARADLLLDLVSEWSMRGMCEVGPAAAARASLLGTLARTTLPAVLAEVKAEVVEAGGGGVGDDGALVVTLAHLEALCTGLVEQAGGRRHADEWPSDV